MSEKKEDTSTFVAETYYKMLEEGPQVIDATLDHFNLEHSSSGRQKLRDANAAFNKQFEGKYKIEGIQIKPEEASKSKKAFQLVAIESQ